MAPRYPSIESTLTTDYSYNYNCYNSSAHDLSFASSPSSAAIAPLSSSSSSSSSSSNLDLSGGRFEFKPTFDLWSNTTAHQSWSLQRQEQQKQLRLSKGVRFARNLVSKEIPYLHVSEITTEERQAAFYQSKDYSNMRAHNEATIDKLNRHRNTNNNGSSPLNPMEETIVGLETRVSPQENALCHRAIKQAVYAVLQEQEDQLRYEGYLNVDILAARYMSYTTSSSFGQDRACWIGQTQQQEAASVDNEDQ